MRLQSGQSSGSQNPRQPAGSEPLVEDRFLVHRKIGQGGMGGIYLAEDTKTGDQAVLKYLSRSFLYGHYSETMLRRLVSQEVDAQSAVRHYGVPAIRHSSGMFFAMDYVSGRALFIVHPTPPEIMEIAMGLADILSTAHGSGVIHRDIKPANVIIRDDGRPVLVDFGSAKICSFSYTDYFTDFPVGTLEFASPEAIEGGNLADERSDQFSLAALLYSEFSGRNPFGIYDRMPHRDALMKRQMDKGHTPLRDLAPHLRPEVCSVIDAALSHDPGERFSSIEHFRMALACVWL